MGNIVAFGHVTSSTDIPILFSSFKKYCKERHCEMIFATADEELASLAMKDEECATLNYGTDLIFNPTVHKPTASGMSKKK